MYSAKEMPHFAYLSTEKSFSFTEDNFVLFAKVHAGCKPEDYPTKTPTGIKLKDTTGSVHEKPS